MIKINEEKDTAYEVAHKIITATVKITLSNGREYESEAFSLLEIKQIGLHLLNYAETEQIDDEERDLENVGI